MPYSWDTNRSDLVDVMRALEPLLATSLPGLQFRSYRIRGSGRHEVYEHDLDAALVRWGDEPIRSLNVAYGRTSSVPGARDRFSAQLDVSGEDSWGHWTPGAKSQVSLWLEGLGLEKDRLLIEAAGDRMGAEIERRQWLANQSVDPAPPPPLIDPADTQQSTGVSHQIRWATAWNAIRKWAATLWGWSNHQVVGGLIVAGVLAVTALFWASCRPSNGNGNQQPPTTSVTTNPTTTTQPPEPPPPAPPTTESPQTPTLLP
jgi:hypothetical protein